ncbi:hypothetical protein AB1Y20_017569 [Prymnesium parvum]|uniref:Uncharacterized protein n=1 Tax=Prymnesium parvum TaxID=97485 RepID=A0AB34JKW1_PRYPA
MRRFLTRQLHSSAPEGWTISTAGRRAASPLLTHTVSNQSHPLDGYNAFTCDASLSAAGATAPWAAAHLSAFGEETATAEWKARADDAHRHPPRLASHDRFGRRVDRVEYCAAYHELMGLALTRGCASFAWGEHAARPGAHVARGALIYLMYQLEPGVCCPLTMTFAAVPALVRAGGVAAGWLPRLCARAYDPRDVPLGEKAAATLGMSMTEKQGGSDVRANTSVATAVCTPGGGVGGGEYTLRGHKWFTSAPMSDGFLTLAQTEEGLSCFLVPRWLPDGNRNSGFTVQRLKAKLGDHSNASSEVEYNNAWGVLVGPAGRGVKTIVEMVVHTRLDCIIGSSALMRHCTQQAAHHAAHRSAFGSNLAQAPLMRAVLADLALESEAANATWLRLASSFDSPADGSGGLLRRVGTAVAKYWVCKRAPGVAHEAMECLGGNGYVEEGPMARMYRQAPLNGIWEGSGNVICLDVMRSLRVEPQAVQAFVDELEGARGAHSLYDGLLDDVRSELTVGAEDLAALEPRARLVVDKMAIALQASCLLQFGDPVIAAAYCSSRLPGLAQLQGASYGSRMADSVPRSTQDLLIDRVMPIG